ncbi:NADH:flavin oxidoreductase/NADH oxidase family protein [Aestuariirhabdus sp. Z084]|uniref:NADH:flavin oxidoreductase/NADH oxidase family protein n=1 Tax=Aestuariirhabdus haliotis TaxID=2918751 RepID=UPI00201B4621|nr:NADH:flavin oxidoreductase/NADH oxidase family protein [Aestuariirhabdus haliotis]MCL6417796.1 NADH:flavin oxidoreductase/NADH oxidase family protein [Aestuariirhabdus haliotis]MCL6421723.1 NADH:flavin oxidoreductase/NADH oxidase family protein [Aestuariirhabdus haliotis]
MSSSPLFTPLTLPCASVLPSRLAKAAMEEGLGEPGQLPGEPIFQLYRRWANGNIGLLITGNVMIDHRAMTGPGGIVLEQQTDLEPFRRWAEAAKSNGGKVWMQINHPGRQVYAAMGGNVWSPSDVPLNLGKHSKLFGQPSPMSDAQIVETIERFTATAVQAEAAGFDGVQIHAAHGYLISQFLSPLTNRRSDQWGGTLENRSRLLIEVIRAIRKHVSSEFAVAVKINSADFQRGGFDEQDAKQVIEQLNQEAVDLVELSGGSYESPAMQGRTADQRTLAREAYFLEFARDIAKVATMPVMTTGGILHRSTAEEVLEKGIDLVGLGTALAMTPDLPLRWQQAEFTSSSPQVNWKDKTLNALAVMALVRRQIHRLGAGKPAQASLSPFFTLIKDQWRSKQLTRRYRNWRQQI